VTKLITNNLFISPWLYSPSRPGPPHCWGFTITDTPHLLGLPWTSDRPLRKYWYLTIYYTQKRETSITLVGFEPAIPANQRPQNYALDHWDRPINKLTKSKTANHIKRRWPDHSLNSDLREFWFPCWKKKIASKNSLTVTEPAVRNNHYPYWWH